MFPFTKAINPKVSWNLRYEHQRWRRKQQLLQPQPPIPDYEARTSLICNINPEVIKAFLMNEPFVRGGGMGHGTGAGAWAWDGGRGMGHGTGAGAWGLPKTRQVFNNSGCRANEAAERQSLFGAV